MGGEDTAEKRKELAEGEATKLKSMLFIPQEIKDHIHEGFEPLLVSEEVVDTHFGRVLDVILDFDSSKSDAQFIEEMKDALAHFVGEWIEELEDGFHNGMQDVVIFFRENFKTVIEAAAGPDMGMMVAMMGTDTIMNYVTKCYTRYRERKVQLRAVAKEREQRKKQGGATQAASKDDVAMKDHTSSSQEEEKKDESPEAKRKRFLGKWESVIASDVETMAEEDTQQRPLSRAYLSLCPANRSTNKQVQDEKAGS